MQHNQKPEQPAFSQEDVIRFYRDLGFFRGGSIAECADRLLTRFEYDMGQRLSPQQPWDDVYLLSYDQENVWADDPECDVCAENEVYREVLPQWSRISRGVFVVEDVNETWHGDEGPITVAFRSGGQQHVLSPTWDNDWLDLDILGQINRVIADTGKQFVCASDVNFAVVFVVDVEGKRKMREFRQFPFIEFAAR